MKTKTNCNAGAKDLNHNETLIRDNRKSRWRGFDQAVSTRSTLTPHASVVPLTRTDSIASKLSRNLRSSISA